MSKFPEALVFLASEAVPATNYFFRVPLLTMVNPQQICYNITQRAFFTAHYKEPKQQK